MFIYRCSKYVTPLLLTLLFSCSRKIPSDIEESLTDFFIYKNRESERRVASVLRDINELDSLLNLIKLKSKTDSSNVILKDYKNRDFTLGFNPPKSFNNSKKYPLIIYLHGGIGTTRTDKGLEAWKMFQFLQKDINIFIASPSANRECPWWDPEGLNRILISLRYMTLNYPIDPDKIFLAGVSDGGTACYAAADQIGEVFAGFFAISGMGLALRNFGINLHPQNLMQRNIYNINAGKDRLYPLEYVQRFITSLEDAGVEIKTKYYKRELHGFDYKEKERNTLLKLISKWHRQKNQSTNHVFSANQAFYNHRVANISFLKDNSSEPFINMYMLNDTVNFRSAGISSADIFIEQKENKKLFIKNFKGLKPLKKAQKSNLQKALVQLRNSYYPGDYNKNIYHITME